MLDGGSFMKSGWVHELKFYTFSSEGTRFVVMAKVTLILICDRAWENRAYLHTNDFSVMIHQKITHIQFNTRIDSLTLVVPSYKISPLYSLP